jgi:hypothetical protein
MTAIGVRVVLLIATVITADPESTTHYQIGSPRIRANKTTPLLTATVYQYCALPLSLCGNPPDCWAAYHGVNIGYVTAVVPSCRSANWRQVRNEWARAGYLVMCSDRYQAVMVPGVQVVRGIDTFQIFMVHPVFTVIVKSS